MIFIDYLKIYLTREPDIPNICPIYFWLIFMQPMRPNECQTMNICLSSSNVVISSTIQAKFILIKSLLFSCSLTDMFIMLSWNNGVFFESFISINFRILFDFFSVPMHRWVSVCFRFAFIPVHILRFSQVFKRLMIPHRVVNERWLMRPPQQHSDRIAIA